MAEAINHLLYTLVLRCVWGNAVLDRFHVGVLGYGQSIGPALGAARLALLSLGLPPEQVLAPPRIARSFVPNAAVTEALQTRLQRYSQTYAPTRAQQS